MKQILKTSVFTAFTLVVFLFPQTASAVDIGTRQGTTPGLLTNAAAAAGYDAATTDTSFASTLGLVVNTALSLMGVIFMALIVYAGFLWMTARGDEAQVEKAISTIRRAVIGLIITVGAYSITQFVVPRIVERTADGGGQTVGN